MVAKVAVAAFPVIEPAIGAVTVSPANVPTEVNDEFTILAGKVVPVKPEAAAGTVMSAVPSKASPFIVLAVASLVAVAALPVTLPAIGMRSFQKILLVQPVG